MSLTTEVWSAEGMQVDGRWSPGFSTLTLLCRRGRLRLSTPPWSAGRRPSTNGLRRTAIGGVLVRALCRLGLYCSAEWDLLERALPDVNSIELWRTLDDPLQMTCFVGSHRSSGCGTPQDRKVKGDVSLDAPSRSIVERRWAEVDRVGV